MSAASVTGLSTALSRGLVERFPSFPSLCNRSCVTPTEAALRRRQHYRLVVGVRAALLAMGLVLTLVSSGFGELLPTFVALVAVAAAASIPLKARWRDACNPSSKQLLRPS